MKGQGGWATATVMAILLGAGVGESQERAGSWVPEHQGPQYFAVLVEEVDSSATWYRRAFGLRGAGGSEAEDGSWRILNLRNEALWVELIRDDRAEQAERPRGFRKVGFFVPDVEEVAERVGQATGERPRVLEFPEFGVRIIQVRDPDGNVIQLFTPLERGGGER